MAQVHDEGQSNAYFQIFLGISNVSKSISNKLKNISSNSKPMVQGTLCQTLHKWYESCTMTRALPQNTEKKVGKEDN
jgi:hypothetical protein